MLVVLLCCYASSTLIIAYFIPQSDGNFLLVVMLEIVKFPWKAHKVHQILTSCTHNVQYFRWWKDRACKDSSSFLGQIYLWSLKRRTHGIQLFMYCRLDMISHTLTFSWLVDGATTIWIETRLLLHYSYSMKLYCTLGSRSLAFGKCHQKSTVHSFGKCSMLNIKYLSVDVRVSRRFWRCNVTVGGGRINVLENPMRVSKPDTSRRHFHTLVRYPGEAT